MMKLPWSKAKKIGTLEIAVGLAFLCSSCGSPSSTSTSASTPSFGTLTRLRSNASANQVCAVNTSGAVGCLGYNNNLTLGDASKSDSYSFKTVITSGAKDVTVGGYHACALLTDGTLKCWGFNKYGTLGNGTTTDSADPVAVSGLTGISQVVVGEYHTCALTTGGAVYCWGSNSYGQVGNGSSTAATTPQAVTDLGSGVARLAASTNATCAVLSNGGAKCWGGLGSVAWAGANSKSSTPYEVAAASVGVSQMSVGAEHVCLVTSKGGAFCFGGNGFGQLGSGNETTSASPVSVSGLSSGVAAVTTMGFSTCARLTDATVKCWGSNSRYQFGLSTPSKSSSPVAVTGLSSVSAIASSYNTMIALKSDGTAVSWGGNTYGTLGTGSSSGALDAAKTPSSATLYSWDPTGGMSE